MYNNVVLETRYNISSSLIFHISLSLDFISRSLSLSFLSSALPFIPLTRISRHSSLPLFSSDFSVFKIRAGRRHYCGWFSLALKQYEGIVVVIVGLQFCILV
ncbi:hypothetical protein V8G54_009526 [Vigna mungo]|uniref:Uncharacterized protein n=1 Tax=Vigna mungo TaxID=3915 RepID=A0AAQ3NUZ5_VIGMU